jgi:hypothetical protein
MTRHRCRHQNQRHRPQHPQKTGNKPPPMTRTC